MTHTGIPWMTRVLLAQVSDAKRVRYNPRPAGQVQTGSATSDVLALLRKHPKRRWRRSQLVAITGRSESAIDWALLYLRAQSLIEGECPMQGRQWSYWLAVPILSPAAPTEGASA